MQNSLLFYKCHEFNDIKQQAKQSVEIYKKLLLTPGLPHAKYDPAAAEAQKAHMQNKIDDAAPQVSVAT